jgi:hypothetical protein
MVHGEVVRCLYVFSSRKTCTKPTRRQARGNFSSPILHHTQMEKSASEIGTTPFPRVRFCVYTSSGPTPSIAGCRGRPVSGNSRKTDPTRGSRNRIVTPRLRGKDSHRTSLLPSSGTKSANKDRAIRRLPGDPATSQQEISGCPLFRTDSALVCLGRGYF